MASQHTSDQLLSPPLRCRTMPNAHAVMSIESSKYNGIIARHGDGSLRREIMGDVSRIS